MDTRNYCVECDMSKPCECKEEEDETKQRESEGKKPTEASSS